MTHELVPRRLRSLARDGEPHQLLRRLRPSQELQRGLHLAVVRRRADGTRRSCRRHTGRFRSSSCWSTSRPPLPNSSGVSSTPFSLSRWNSFWRNSEVTENVSAVIAFADFCSSAMPVSTSRYCGSVAAERLDEVPLAVGQRVEPNHEIGHDTAAAAHDSARGGAVDRPRPDGGVTGGRDGLPGDRVAGFKGRLLRLILFAVRRPLDRPAARGEPAGRRELERHALAQREERLDQALAEGGRADHHRPVVVLERARDDLRGAGAALVHEHDDREVGPGLPRVVEELLGRSRGPGHGWRRSPASCRGTDRRPRRPGRGDRPG